MYKKKNKTNQLSGKIYSTLSLTNPRCLLIHLFIHYAIMHIHLICLIIMLKIIIKMPAPR